MSDDIQDPRYHMSLCRNQLDVCFHLYVSLYGPGWLYVLGMPPRGSPRLSTHRACATDTSARVHNCAVVFEQAPCVHRRRDHEKNPATRRKKNAAVKRKHISFRSLAPKSFPSGVSKSVCPHALRKLRTYELVFANDV